MSLVGATLPQWTATVPKTVRPRSVASHLALLCIAVTIPVLACVSAVLWRYADAEQRKLESRGLESVREISEVLNIDILSLSAILRTLSASSRIQVGDLPSFYDSALEVTRQTDLPVVLSDRDGRTILNTRFPLGSELPDVDPGVHRAIEAKGPIVTDLFTGATGRHLMYAVAVPVFRRNSEDVTHVLHFSINPRRIRDILLRNIGAQQERASVIDRNGRILARTLNDEMAQGLKWQGFARAAGEKDGVFRHKNLEGVESLTSFTRMRSTGWIVVNGVDSEVVDGPMRVLLWQLAAIAALTALIAGAIGFVLSRRLLTSLQLLETNTIRIGAGAPLRRIVTPVLEVNRIADFLTNSSKELQQANEAREALLYEVNHRVKNSLAVVTSILSMQARQTSTAQERRALIELRARIDVIARVHQSLYESGCHNSVHVGEFISEVATTTLQALDPGRTFQLSADCETGVVMPVHRITPLALIAAELITNAVKHAHPSARGCKITIRFAHQGANGLTLLVADDGEGLAADFDPSRSTGVGMRIITGLLKQLRGAMTTNAGEPGARFLITLTDAQVEP